MTMPTDWWRDFFSGLATEFWHAFPTAAMTAAEVDGALGQLAPPAGGRLLDVPCGDGRHAAAFADRGFQVDAVDLAPAMLAFAHAAVGPRAVTLHRRDQRDLPWTAEFDGACCLGNSFGYLGDPGDRDFLVAVRRTLRPGARFVLDAATVESVLPHLQAQRWFEAGGILFCSAVRYDVASGVLRSDYVFARGASQERKTAWIRLRAAAEVAAMLRTAGFAGVSVVDERGESPRPGSRTTFVATA